jgi:drug/metabolite transporter (DMT)-like permease
MSSRTKGLIAIFIAAVLWASAGAVAKVLFREVSPFVVAFQRFGLASLIMLPFFLREKKPKGYFRALLPLGIFNAGNILFYYSGLSLTTANTAIILGAAVPLTTVILSPFIIKEHVTREKLAGILIGLIGALFVVVLPLLHNGGIATGNIYGNLLLVGSLLCWTLYIIYSRSILSRGSFSPVLSTSINIFAVTIFTAIASLLTRQSLFPVSVSSTYLWVLVYAALGITVITFFLFQWGVQYVSASTASLKEYLQLIIGVGLNAAILGEHLTGAYILGSILVMVGVFVATGRNISKKLIALIESRGM